MKHVISIISAIILLATFGCNNNDGVYNAIPREISSFVDQYYPNSEVQTFTSSGNLYRLVVKNGPTMLFDKTYSWEMLNGNGNTLPQNFLFNELPPEVYAYLQETEDLNEVYSVERNSKDYIIVLLDYTLTYDISSGDITGGEAAK